MTNALEKKYSDVDIIDAFERCRKEEEENCRCFCELNPAHTAWREKVRDYIISGMNMVLTELKSKGR